MRPFPHDDRRDFSKKDSKRAWLEALILFALVTSGLQGCASLGAGLVTPIPRPTPSPSPPASTAVTIMPASATVILGNSQTFTATVKNASDATVVWSVNGIAGGNPQIGTISASGVYTAPADLPAPTAMQISATSVADATKLGKSQVTSPAIWRSPSARRRPPWKLERHRVFAF